MEKIHNACVVNGSCGFRTFKNTCYAVIKNPVDVTRRRRQYNAPSDHLRLKLYTLCYQNPMPAAFAEFDVRGTYIGTLCIARAHNIILYTDIID